MLWGHVADRAHHEPRLRELLLGVERLGDTEIGEIRVILPADLAEQYVRWLDVAVDEPSIVNGLQSTR